MASLGSSPFASSNREWDYMGLQIDESADLEVLAADVLPLPAFKDLVPGSTDVCVRRAAFAGEGVRDANAIGWRALVTAKEVNRKVSWVKVYGAWVKYEAKFIGGIAQEASDEEGDEEEEEEEDDDDDSDDGDSD